MFKRVLLSLLFICPPLFAEELQSFDLIIQDLKVGKDIRVVVNNSLCEINDPNEYKIPVSTMINKPSAILFTDKLLSFDAVKFAGSKLPFANNGLLQRGIFALNNNGNVIITISFFDAETNKKIPQWNDVKILCQLGEGVQIYQG